MKLIIQTFLVLAITLGAVFFFFSTGSVDLDAVTQEEVTAARALLQSTLATPRYTHADFMREHGHMVNNMPPFSTHIPHTGILEGESYTTFTVDVPTRGIYYFSLDYELFSTSFTSVTVSLQVNGQQQHEEANTIILPAFWEDESKDFPLNRFGDESPPSRRQIFGMQRVMLFDVLRISDRPLGFLLEAGPNTIQIFNHTSREIGLGGLGVYAMEPLPHFQAQDPLQQEGLITLNATMYDHLNSPWVRLTNTRSPAHYPTDPVDVRINTVRMGRVGDELFYNLEITQAGYYPITLFTRTVNNDFPVFVSVRINGQIPFAEAASYVIPPFMGRDWRNHTMTSSSGEPLLFYFPVGTHTLSIRTELDPVAEHISDLLLVINHINQFSMDIRRIAGRHIDENRTWRFTRYEPYTVAYLEAYRTVLTSIISDLAAHSPQGQHSMISTNLIQAITFLNHLLERPDELPVRAGRLIDSGASVLQMVGVSLDYLMDVELDLSAIYLGGLHHLPGARPTFVQSTSAGIQRLWSSYTSDKYVIRNQEGALNVWMNASIPHVDTLQRLIDLNFTAETGIAVNLRVMPDQGRLIMSQAANTNPDVALGLEPHLPFELASRGALLDLTQFNDFWYYMDNIVPGSLVGYVFNEGVYAMPEAIDFVALLYRSDILNQLNMELPQTWADVALMQSELQRFGMSFFHPIATGPGMKGFYQTSPLIYQNGGALFNPDGLTTAISQPQAVEALTFLGDLFTTYALPAQVPVFFNSFRFGQTPFGIVDVQTYILLTETVPELTGLWNIAPFPGTRQPDGSIDRWFIANGSAAIVFDNTEMPEEAWQFLQWYMSTETQVEFTNLMMANFNILWRTANIHALEYLPIEYRHRQVILDSMQWLRNPPRSPGGYMLERRLSDIWNTMAFEGTSAQVAIDLLVLDVNRELQRKMVEFGFADELGNPLNPYVVRELDWVVEQIENARR